MNYFDAPPAIPASNHASAADESDPATFAVTEAEGGFASSKSLAEIALERCGASTRAARRSNVEYIVRYLAFILGCSIAAITSGGAVAHENIRPPEGKIAYELMYPNKDGTGSPGPRWLAVGDLAGANVRFLSSQPKRNSRRRDTDPAFSPGGTRVAFFHKGKQPGLYVARADGSASRRISTGAASRLSPTGPPIWSPDGTRIAFALLGATCPLRNPANAGIYLAASDGSSVRKLSALVRNGGSLPSDIQVYAWSPDGRKLLYSEGKFGGNCGRENCCNSALYEIRVQGGRPLPLTGKIVTGYGLVGSGWSADGTILAYQDCGSSISCAIVVRRGKKSWRPEITDANHYPTVFPGQLRWAPHGHVLAALAMNNQNGMADAYLLDADRRAIKKLKTVDGFAAAEALAWSSDGAFLVTLVDWPPVTYILSRDGTYAHRLRGPRPSQGTDFGSEDFALSVR